MIRDDRAFFCVVDKCLSILVDRSRRMSPRVCSYDVDPRRSGGAVVPAYDLERVSERSRGGVIDFDKPPGPIRWP